MTTNAPSSPCSSFRRKPESSSFLLPSYPRKRDHRRWGWSTILLLPAQVQGFHSPCGRAGNFLCLCKESHQRNTPPVARLPGILPSRYAIGLRGSLNAHPCAYSELARIVRAILRTLPSPPRRATGAPFRRHPAAEAEAQDTGICRFRGNDVREESRIPACAGMTTRGAIGRRRCDVQGAFRPPALFLDLVIDPRAARDRAVLHLGIEQARESVAHGDDFARREQSYAVADV